MDFYLESCAQRISEQHSDISKTDLTLAVPLTGFSIRQFEQHHQATTTATSSSRTSINNNNIGQATTTATSSPRTSINNNNISQQQ